MAKAAIAQAVSVANATTPPACSRDRSRRARSASGSSFPAPTATGSTTRRSTAPPGLRGSAGRSSTHRQVTGSAPLLLAARAPAGKIYSHDRQLPAPAGQEAVGHESRSCQPAPAPTEGAAPDYPHDMDRTDGRRLMLVHAHPDDESIGTGATMAKYAAQGAGVTLV